MIISNKPSKTTPWLSNFFRRLLFLFKSSYKPIPIKFSFKHFIFTVISTILIWTLIASSIIYRNAYKEGIGELANELNFKGRREKHRLEQAIKAFILAPFNWIAANLFPEQLPHIYIDLKYKHYLKLLKKREEAIRKGHLIRSPDDYVPALIKYENKSYPVKLRLKGDLDSHWAGEKWSFRIKMKKKDSLFGMKRFSIQNPEERLYEGAIIFFEDIDDAVSITCSIIGFPNILNKSLVLREFILLLLPAASIIVVSDIDEISRNYFFFFSFFMSRN